MSATSRRVFISQAAALVPLSRTVLAKEPLRSSNLGVQLYTVRNVITKDPAATLQAIQDIGYTEIEATYANLDQIWPALQQTKLKPVSVHVDLAIFKEGGSRFESTLAELKQRNFEYVVVPYIPQDQRGGMDVFKSLAEMLNKSGERAKANGLTLCYHNHAFEFKSLEGTYGLAVLMRETQKNLVSLEMDIFWVSVAGHDPVELLKKYTGRVALLHLKDKARGLAPQYNESVPPETFKEVGNGSIDIAAVLTEANRAGVRQYFVEQDQTPGDPIASLRESYKYLSSLFKS
ncbi:MAG: sugar phosphate isomerase/epimerase [Acidobacteriaceae bacterium]|nr:sugar phosphate isomerase/epimerase [Acidobacteriaceae bacterium]MBV9296902.1 sugar phosphate isomerase/epimerase [Acidobacteriaceae bacterium]MBV9764055.1 sugar phosphate isomerase/epimerase [Acidobacteriaceae bacterium]